MANKYLKGGALNPAWCDEQDAAFEAERIMESTKFLHDLIDDINIELNLQLGEGVGINISKNKNPKEEMCTIVNAESDYEAKFNFLKNHSNTPDELELAMKIIGLK